MDFLGDRFTRRGRAMRNAVWNANLCNYVAVAMVAWKRRLLSETKTSHGFDNFMITVLNRQGFKFEVL